LREHIKTDFGERSPNKQKPGGHFHASENRLKSGPDHSACLCPLNWGIFPKNQKFMIEGRTERFLTFFIFQIPPEKNCCDNGDERQVRPLLKTCALSSPEN
jgi:hypothetical protein